MSLTQLTAQKLPRYSGNLSRSLRNSRRALQKSFRSRTRKLKRTSLAVIRRQYYVTDAYSDIRTYARRNEDIFLGSLICSVAIAYSFTTLAAQAIFLFFKTAWDFSDSLGINMAFLLFAMFLTIGCFSSWLAAMMLNMQAISLMDGAINRPTRSLRATMRRALATATRTTCTWMLFLLIVGLPLAAMGITALIAYKLIGGESMTSPAIVGGSLTLPLAWLLYALMQFSLAPQVALFEPQVPLLACFKRSRELVRRRGKLFVLATYVLIASLLGIAYVLANFVQKQCGLDRSLLFGILTAAIIFFGNSLFVALYRKRKAARRY